ncbi:MAG: formate/nitrite transporter family protein [Arcticibacter sp.]
MDPYTTNNSDAYSPASIAERVEQVGVAKANMPLLQMVVLGMLAGAFIGLGAMANNLVLSDPLPSMAATRILGGAVFSLGLMLVVVAGAELFTGNNLVVMAYVDGRISFPLLLRNWTVVLLSNFAGAMFLAWLVWMSGHGELLSGKVGERLIATAQYKCLLSADRAFFSGILCNVLVCLAVWMTFAGRSVTDKILAILFPITVFVAAGFEHSIANMFIIPLAWLLQQEPLFSNMSNVVSLSGMLHNLLPVVAGNLVGGGIFVGLVYYLVYGGNLNKKK